MDLTACKQRVNGLGHDGEMQGDSVVRHFDPTLDSVLHLIRMIVLFANFFNQTFTTIIPLSNSHRTFWEKVINTE